MADATAAPAAPAAAPTSTQATGKPTTTPQAGASQGGQAPAQPQGGIAQAKAKLEGQKAPVTPRVAPAPVAGDWGDEQETQLWELMKRSPYAKVKAGGREVAIDSKEAWENGPKRALERVQGINALTESAKKQLEAAKAIETKHSELERVIERARSGDESAIRALGILHPIERQEQQKFLESLDPTTRAIAEENQRMRAAEEQRVQSEAQRQAETQRQQLLGEAKTIAGDVANALAGEDGKIDPATLFFAVQHMDVMHRAGAKLGIDYTAQDLRDFALEQYEAQGLQRTLAMGPKMLPHVVPAVADAGFEALVAHLPDDKARAFAQEASRWLLKARRGASVSPLTPQPPVVGQSTKLSPQAEPQSTRQPLSALRFRR